MEEMLERLMPLVDLVQTMHSNAASTRDEQAGSGTAYAPPSGSTSGPPRQHIHELAGNQKIGRPGQVGGLQALENFPYRPLPHSSMPQSTIKPMRSVTQPVTMRDSAPHSVHSYHTGLSSRIVSIVCLIEGPCLDLPLTTLVNDSQDGLPAPVPSTTLTSYVTSDTRSGTGSLRQVDLPSWKQSQSLHLDQGYPLGSNDIFSPLVGGVQGPGPNTTSNMSVDAIHGEVEGYSRDISPSRYGPRESQSAAQEKDKDLPATWQERLAGRMGKDNSGHMR
jgi:hypothetical protein